MTHVIWTLHDLVYGFTCYMNWYCTWVVVLCLTVSIAAEPSNNVAVVKVLASRANADKEAARLSQVNAGKTSAYHVYATRFVP